MHEQSETIQIGGKWINVYGRKTPRAGEPLPGMPPYDTVEEAVAAAKQRSEQQNGKTTLSGRKRSPRELPDAPE